MKRFLSTTKLPGAQLYVAEITDNCRKCWGDGEGNPANEARTPRAKESLQAFDEAVRRLRKAFADTVEGREKNDCDDNVSYHLGLSLEDHRHVADETIIKVIISRGGIIIPPDVLTPKQLAKVLVQVKEMATKMK